MLITFTKESKSAFENGKWNYPKGKWNDFSNYMTSNHKTSFIKYCQAQLQLQLQLQLKLRLALFPFAPATLPPRESLFSAPIQTLPFS